MQVFSSNSFQPPTGARERPSLLRGLPHKALGNIVANLGEGHNFRATGRGPFNIIPGMIQGKPYASDDINLMRGFESDLKNTCNLDIDNQLLRSILPDLKSIKVALDKGCGGSLFPNPPDDNKSMIEQTIGDIKLKIYLDTNSPRKITGISLFNGTICGDKEPIKKIVNLVGNSVIEDENGVQTCDVLKKADGSTYNNWRRFKDGVQTCDCLTTHDGSAYNSWKYENGVQTCREKKANEFIFKGWQLKDGIQTCECITAPDGSSYTNWQFKDGIQTCDVLRKADGFIFIGWQREGSVETFQSVKEAHKFHSRYNHFRHHIQQ
jgi:hypothetical protein